MIAVDTNVLLRRLLNDDPVQSELARRLFEKHGLILITDVVLVETVWTLKSKRYKRSKKDIGLVITALLEESNVVFENQQVIWSALNQYINAPAVSASDAGCKVDFSDALIVQKSRMLSEMWGENYDGTYTFDLAAQKLPGTRAP